MNAPMSSGLASQAAPPAAAPTIPTGAGGEGAGAFSLAWLRQCPDCVALTTPQGRLSFVGDRARLALGLGPLSHLGGQDIWDIWSRDQRPALREAVARATAREAVRLRLSRPDRAGRSRDWDVTLSAIVNAEGGAESILVVFRDPGAA